MERDNNGRFAASPPMRSPERERLAEAIAAEQAATARLARLRTTLASTENQSYDLSEAITEKEQAIAEAERRAPQSRLAILLGDLAPAADPLPALRDELTALREQRAALVEDIATLREGISGNPHKNAPGAAGAVESARARLSEAIAAEAVASPEGDALVARLAAVTVEQQWLIGELGAIGIVALAKRHGVWLSVLDQRVRSTAGALGDSLPSPPPSEWAPALQKMRTDPDAPLPKTRVEAPGVG